MREPVQEGRHNFQEMIGGEGTCARGVMTAAARLAWSSSVGGTHDAQLHVTCGVTTIAALIVNVCALGAGGARAVGRPGVASSMLGVSAMAASLVGVGERVVARGIAYDGMRSSGCVEAR